MAKTIWKQPLDHLHSNLVRTPKGAQFLHAREQQGRPTVWFECDPDEELEIRVLAVYATGENIPDSSGRYLGTASLMAGRLVFHVYDTGKTMPCPTND